MSAHVDLRVAAICLPDVEEGKETKDVVPPLVGRADQSTDKTANYDDPRPEGDCKDFGKRKTRRSQDQEEQQREVDEPLDVPNILHVLVSK